MSSPPTISGTDADPVGYVSIPRFLIEKSMTEKKTKGYLRDQDRNDVHTEQTGGARGEGVMLKLDTVSNPDGYTTVDYYWATAQE